MRISRILPDGVAPSFDAAKLSEPAELALAERVGALGVGVAELPIAALLDETEPVVAQAATFFHDILVNAEDADVRAARQGLLATFLASVPAGIAWKALDASSTGRKQGTGVTF